MQITLTNQHISNFAFRLKHCSGSDISATHTGVFAGTKYALEQMGLFNQNREIVVDIDKEIINDLVRMLEINKLKALWNIGYASGIAWVLEEFGLYKID
ncbi:hypothetical protein D3C78_20070 [compost metagenome]